MERQLPLKVAVVGPAIYPFVVLFFLVKVAISTKRITEVECSPMETIARTSQDEAPKSPSASTTGIL